MNIFKKKQNDQFANVNSSINENKKDSYINIDILYMNNFIAYTSTIEYIKSNIKLSLIYDDNKKISSNIDNEEVELSINNSKINNKFIKLIENYDISKFVIKVSTNLQLGYLLDIYHLYNEKDMILINDNDEAKEFSLYIIKSYTELMDIKYRYIKMKEYSIMNNPVLDHLIVFIDNKIDLQNITTGLYLSNTEETEYSWYVKDQLVIYNAKLHNILKDIPSYYNDYISKLCNIVFSVNKDSKLFNYLYNENIENNYVELIYNTLDTKDRYILQSNILDLYENLRIANILDCQELYDLKSYIETNYTDVINNSFSNININNPYQDIDEVLEEE